MSVRVRVGPFELEHRLGRGGMAEVWRARHIEHGEPAAIKVVHPRLAADQRYIERFWREVDAMARLEHPGIVEVLDAGVVSPDLAGAVGVSALVGSPWLAMPLLQDGTLGSSPPRSWDELSPQLFSLLDALAHAHARGVLHRDLKPSNVLRETSLVGPCLVRIADFGLARAVATGRDRDDAFGLRGTPMYMAPEQFRGQDYPVGPWSDLFAVGVMVWELVTGERPFAAQKPEDILRAKLANDIVPFRPRYAVPRSFDVWLKTLMASSPSRRFRRAASASNSLRSLLIGQPAGRLAAAVAPGPRAPGVPVVAFADPESSGHDGPPVPLCAAPETPSSGSKLRGPGLFSLRRAAVMGRRAERAALWDELRATTSQKGPRVVLIHGVPGTGRHRLADWLAERAHASGVAEVFRAEGAAGADLIGHAISAHLQVDTVPEAQRRRRIEAWCAVHQRDPGDHDASALHALLPGSGAPVLTAPLTLVAEERQALRVRVLRRLASDRVPLFVVQRSTAASMRAVDELVATWGTGPLLVVVCADDATVASADLARCESICDIDLGLLSSTAIAASIRTMITLDPALEKQVVALADGVPAVATALVRQLVAREQLEPFAGGYRLISGARVPVHEGVSTIALARFDEVELQVPAEARRDVRHQLELAAVLGPDVSSDEWTEAVERAGLVEHPRLVEFVTRAGLGRVTPSGWRFAHAGFALALRESARVGGRLESWHLICAEAVSAVARAGSSRVAGRVGRHLLRGGNALAAIDLLHLASVGAVWRGDTATAWDVLADRDVAMDAVHLATGCRERMDSALLRAWCAALEGRLGLASASADEAASGARAGHCDDVLGGVAAVRGVIALHRDRPIDAIPWFDESVARFESAGDRRWQRRAQSWSAWTNLTIGRIPEAWSQAWHVLTDDLDPRESSTLRARLVACRVALELGHTDVARTWLGDVRRRLNEGIHAGPLRARAEQVRGLIALADGDRSGAWRAFSRGRRCAPAPSSPEGRLARFELAVLALEAGRRAEAERRLRKLAVERPVDAGLGPWIATARVVASPDEVEHERRLTTVEMWLAETRGGTRRLASLARRASVLVPRGPIATVANSVDRLASAAVARQDLMHFDPAL